MPNSGHLPVRDITDETSAFAFVLGVLFNQQVRADRAWTAPWVLADRLGTLRPADLAGLPLEDFMETFARPPVLHPFKDVMAERALETACLIKDTYAGDARAMWTDATAGEVLQRLRALPGIGDHKARVGLFVLTRELGITVRGDGGSYSIRACGRLTELYDHAHEPVLT